jgi:hypothetical protein
LVVLLRAAQLLFRPPCLDRQGGSSTGTPTLSGWISSHHCWLPVERRVMKMVSDSTENSRFTQNDAVQIHSSLLSVVLPESSRTFITRPLPTIARAICG